MPKYKLANTLAKHWFGGPAYPSTPTPHGLKRVLADIIAKGADKKLLPKRLRDWCLIATGG